jgi:hypothetical protein
MVHSEGIMSATYDAILRDNQLEWSAAPPVIAPGTAVHVQVIVGQDATAISEEERRAQVLLALERIAARGGIESIPDPAAWQREIRTDRNLPGR